MSFNNNELILISKYIEHNDYNTYFKIFPNINKLYKSTFNYFNFETYDDFIYKFNFMNYSQINFPNVEEININITNKFDIDEIIIMYNKLVKIYPDKFIKICISNCTYFGIYEPFDFDFYKNIFTTFDKLIYENHINKSLKICFEDSENVKKFKNKLKELNLKNNFICFVKVVKNEDEIIFKDNEIYQIKNKYINMLIKDKNDLDKYKHVYKNNLIYYGKNVHYNWFEYIPYFPSLYKIMKLNTKINGFNFIMDEDTFNACDNIITTYIWLRHSTEGFKYTYHYIFGYYPLKTDVAKVTSELGNIHNIGDKYVLKILLDLLNH